MTATMAANLCGHEPPAGRYVVAIGEPTKIPTKSGSIDVSGKTNRCD